MHLAHARSMSFTDSLYSPTNEKDRNSRKSFFTIFHSSSPFHFTFSNIPLHISEFILVKRVPSTPHNASLTLMKSFNFKLPQSAGILVVCSILARILHISSRTLLEFDAHNASIHRHASFILTSCGVSTPGV